MLSAERFWAGIELTRWRRSLASVLGPVAVAAAVVQLEERRSQRRNERILSVALFLVLVEIVCFILYIYVFLLHL